MKTLKTYAYLPEALLDKSRLDDAGMDAFVSGENTGTIGYGGMFNEISLQVADEDFEKAREVLQARPQPLTDDADTGNGSAPAVTEPEVPHPAAWKFFLGGGAVMILFVALLSLFTVVVGGNVELDIGGLLFLFFCGGLFGLVARVFYVRGLERGRQWADERG